MCDRIRPAIEILLPFIRILMDPSIFLAVISVGIAIIALFQTQKQIELSNKQQLFDRRLADYMLLNELADTYERYYESKETETNAWTILRSLMETGFLINAQGILLDRNSVHNQNEYQIKVEEIQRFALEIEIVFPEKVAYTAGIFLRGYSKTLQVLLNNLSLLNANESNGDECFQKKLSEYKQDQEEKLKKCLEELQRAFVKVQEEKIKNKMQKYLKLDSRKNRC